MNAPYVLAIIHAAFQGIWPGSRIPLARWQAGRKNLSRQDIRSCYNTDHPNLIINFAMTKRVMKRRAKKAGLPPGSLVYLGDKLNTTTKISLFDYLDGHLIEREITQPEECAPFKESSTVTWINVDGIQDIRIVEKIGKQYDLHPLVMEDILNTDQRPKVEDHERYLYVVLKMLSYNDAEQEIAIEQLSLILGDNFVLSFQDKPGDVLDPLRERIRQSKGRIRKLGADYLLYAIMDEVVDHYYFALQAMDLLQRILLRAHGDDIFDLLDFFAELFQHDKIMIDHFVHNCVEQIIGAELADAPFRLANALT